MLLKRAAVLPARFIYTLKLRLNTIENLLVSAKLYIFASLMGNQHFRICEDIYYKNGTVEFR